MQTFRQYPYIYSASTEFNRVKQIISKIDFSNFLIPTTIEIDEMKFWINERICIRITLQVRERETKQLSKISLDQYFHTERMEDTEIVDVIRIMIHQAINHEIDECFKYEGNIVKDPHK